MKTKNRLLIIFFIGIAFYANAQITSGKKTFKFDNAPELSIENIVFTDENKNQIADPGEKCYLAFKVKNSGKTKAKAVKIITGGTDPVNSFFSFSNPYPVGDVQSGETKEVKIQMTAVAVFKSSKLNFNLIANDLDNYSSTPVFYSIPVKLSKISEAFAWTYPDKDESIVSKNIVTIKACILSTTLAKDISIYKNNKKVSVERGFIIRKIQGCEQYIEQEVKLDEGNNLIQIKAKVNNNLVESEVRNMVYKKPEYEKRIALVVGNADYPTVPLRNPVNDANLISTELRKARFDVRTIKNGSQVEMKKAISEFGELLAKDKNSVGLFYYAGHGIQMNGKNYLVPTDARINKEPDVEVYCVDLDGLLANLEYSGNRLNIIILDACRNNPYSRSFRSMASNGLATVNAPVGTFIAYATAPGSVAADGDGNNGLYTQEFVKAIETPYIKIEEVFKKVRTSVKTISGGEQIPWENSSIEGDFYFIK